MNFKPTTGDSAAIERLFHMMRDAEAKRAEKDKQRFHFKVYIHQGNEIAIRMNGTLPSYPQQPWLMGAPVITTEWWWDLDHYPHASSFGAGDCMHCTYVPEALKTLAEGIENWL